MSQIVYTGHHVPVAYRGEHWRYFKTLALILGIGRRTRRKMRRELRVVGVVYWNGEAITLSLGEELKCNAQR